jgi:hypothetical protein
MQTLRKIMEELRPLFQELTAQPIAFFGGLVSGLLRLDPNQDPLKSWLKSQNIAAPSSTVSDRASEKAPQSISID